MGLSIMNVPEEKQYENTVFWSWAVMGSSHIADKQSVRLDKACLQYITCYLLIQKHVSFCAAKHLWLIRELSSEERNIHLTSITYFTWCSDILVLSISILCNTFNDTSAALHLEPNIIIFTPLHEFNTYIY